MELRQLEHFVTVAHERHFTRASEMLRISQSGLSASVRSLEVELGASLFVRSTRRVELTTAGRAFLVEANRTLASAAAARTAVDAVTGVLRGRITVGTEPCVGSIDVPGELARFRTSHPDVDIRLRYSGSLALVESVAEGATDAAIVAAPGEIPPGVRLHELGSQRLIVLTHPDHPFASQRDVDLRTLSREPIVGFQSGWGVHDLARRAFAAAGLDYRTQLEVNDVHPLLDLVGHNLGVAIVPESFARKRPALLRAVALHDEMPLWTACVAVAAEPSPAATAFLAQLLPLTEASSAPRSAAGDVNSAA